MNELVAKVESIDAARKIHPDTKRLILRMLDSLGKPDSLKMAKLFGFKFDIEPYGDDGLTLIKESPTDIMRMNYCGRCESKLDFKLKVMSDD